MIVHVHYMVSGMGWLVFDCSLPHQSISSTQTRGLEDVSRSDWPLVSPQRMTKRTLPGSAPPPLPRDPPQVQPKLRVLIPLLSLLFLPFYLPSLPPMHRTPHPPPRLVMSMVPMPCAKPQVQNRHKSVLAHSFPSLLPLCCTTWAKKTHLSPLIS